MRAAGSDDPVSLDALGCSVCSLQRDEHPVTVVVHRDNLGAAVHDDAVLGEPAGQDLLGPPLRQAALKLPRAADAGKVRLGDRLQIGVEHPRVPEVHRRQQDLRDDAGLREDLQRSRLQRRRPGLARRHRLALDNAGADPVPC